MKPSLAKYIALAVVLSLATTECTKSIAAMGEARRASETQENDNGGNKPHVIDPYTQYVVENTNLEESVDYDTWRKKFDYDILEVSDNYESLELQELEDYNDRVRAYEDWLGNAKKVERKVVINPENEEEEYYYEVIEEEDNTNEDSNDNKVLTR